jgi:hypothetical protein
MMSNPSKAEDGIVDWSDMGREMWTFLTGRQAEINYRFRDMTVEIPRAARASWKIDGTLQLTTRDNEISG